MFQLTRRALLRAAPASALAVVLPSAALAAIPAPAATPAERLQMAIDELQSAAKAAYPEIDNWRIGLGHDGGCPVLVCAFIKDDKGEAKTA